MPLDKSDDMGDWIKDFYKSDAPQFKGKSKEKRRQMAIAAKLNAENVLLRDTDITLSEKRAFILAARQAYADGKKSFVFKEKTFPCTIKEDDNLFSELTDYLITKKEQFGKVVEATDDSTGDNVDDGEAPSPDIEDDELEKATDMAKQRYQKFGYEDSDVTGQALPESTIGDKLMKSSDGDTVDTDIIRQDPMKFHNPRFGKPIVAHCYSTDEGHFDFIFFSDGKYVLGVPGHRQEHPGRYPSPDEEAFIFALKKSSYNDFKKEAMAAAKGAFNSAPMKVLKFDTKIRDFKGKAGPNDPRGRGHGPSQFKIDRMPKTTFREEVEYYDRESMPSAVDDASDVMSSYTKFLKSTKSYY